MKDQKKKKFRHGFRDALGKFHNVKFEDNDREGTDDVFKIACHITNLNSFDVYMIEDDRFIPDPVKYLIKPNEKILVPHTYLIPWNEAGLEMKLDMTYGETKLK